MSKLDSSSPQAQKKASMQPSVGDSLRVSDITEFARMMKKLVNNKDFSDIKFVIGPNKKPIFAHRCILSARCTVFKAMFADKPEKDVPLVLSDMSSDIFLAMLEFIYTNCVTLSLNTATDVLATSLEYGLDELRDLCVDFLKENISVSNACDIMQAAVTYNQNDLKEQAMCFVEENTTEILKTKSFLEISEDTLVSILRSSRLTMDEIDLYKAVKEWAKFSSAVNGKQPHEVARDAVKHLRLPLVSPEELKKLEEENKKDCFIPVASFSYAWKLHALKEGDKDNILSTCRRGTTTREHHKYLSHSKSK